MDQVIIMIFWQRARREAQLRASRLPSLLDATLSCETSTRGTCQAFFQPMSARARFRLVHLGTHLDAGRAPIIPTPAAAGPPPSEFPGGDPAPGPVPDGKIVIYGQPTSRVCKVCPAAAFRHGLWGERARCAGSSDAALRPLCPGHVGLRRAWCGI